MNRRRLFREYSTDFASGNYKPGHAKMDHKGGKSVTGRNLGSIGYGQGSEMTDHGAAWPRKHNETAAMCDVEDSGVEDKPQGVHQSRSGSPDLPHLKNVNHDWPKKAKNSGGTRPMKGSRYSDAGVLGQQDMNEWSPNKIGSMMTDEANLQKAFDAYAKISKWVSLEGFHEYADASGLNVTIDENILLQLIDNNRDYVFYESSDREGSYWTPRVLNELYFYGDENEVENEAPCVACGEVECECPDMDDDGLCDHCGEMPCQCDHPHQHHMEESMDEGWAEGWAEEMEESSCGSMEESMDEGWGEEMEESSCGSMEESMDEGWDEEMEESMDEGWGEEMEECWD